MAYLQQVHKYQKNLGRFLILLNFPNLVNPNAHGVNLEFAENCVESHKLVSGSHLVGRTIY